MFTPSASNRSALPQRLETDRLPCLATRTPHAATTSAATVETLNVWARSPPVPHVSNTSPGGARQRRGLGAHHTRQPDDFGRPLALHRQRDEQAGDLRRHGAAVHDLGHRRRGLLDRQVLAPLQLLNQRGEHACPLAGTRSPVTSSRKLRSSVLPLVGQDRFRMELHAVNRIGPVPHAHDRAVIGVRRQLEVGRQRCDTISEW